MKKFILCTALILVFLLAAGCQKKDIKLITDDIKANTLLVKNDGFVQAATVEKFDKDYYSEDELKQYITGQISDFNEKVGQDALTIDSLKVKDGNAILILNYSNLKFYNAFNNNETILTTTTSARNADIKLPDVFVSAADGAYASTEAALENDKYKVLIVHEKNTEVFIDGSIKYYTTGVIDSKTRLQTGSDDETVIIYKP